MEGKRRKGEGRKQKGIKGKVGEKNGGNKERGMASLWHATQHFFLHAQCNLYRCPVSYLQDIKPPTYHNFDQTLNFGRLLYPPPFANQGHIWRARADTSSMLTNQISSGWLIVLPLRSEKSQINNNIM